MQLATLDSEGSFHVFNMGLAVFPRDAGHVEPHAVYICTELEPLEPQSPASCSDPPSLLTVDASKRGGPRARSPIPHLNHRYHAAIKGYDVKFQRAKPNIAPQHLEAERFDVSDDRGFCPIAKHFLPASR